MQIAQALLISLQDTFTKIKVGFQDASSGLYGIRHLCKFYMNSSLTIQFACVLRGSTQQIGARE